jgi:hypothetical protein
MACISFRAIVLSAAVSILVLSAGRDVAAGQSDIAHLDGQLGQLLLQKNARIVVLIFGATDCPISNRYIPEISRLEREFASSYAAFWWVFPNPGDTAAVIRKHQAEYSVDLPTLVDSNQQLVRMAGVTVTPEAAVFSVKNGKMREVYHGRIDDRYIAFGRERSAASHHDLEDAVRAALINKPVLAASGGPVGCSIVPVVSAQGIPLHP